MSEERIKKTAAEKKAEKKERKLRLKKEKREAKRAKKYTRKRIPGKKFYNYKKKRGDRNDGWRVHSDDPVFYLIPYLMNTRLDSMVFFEERVDIEYLDKFVRKARREGNMPQLARIIVFMAAFVRAVSQYPNLNRFVVGGKIYARNSLEICMTIKREMTIEASEETIKVAFDPDFTLQQVYDAVMTEINKVKGTREETGSTNDTGVAVDIVSSLPNWLIKGVVNYFRRRDKKKGMQKLIKDISPFHTSVFITDIGSVGIGSVYHHLYEFGTCSIFAGVGKKEKMFVREDDGVIRDHQSINLRFTVDERIGDGFYYGKAIRYIVHLLKHPDELLTPPEQVIEDTLH